MENILQEDKLKFHYCVYSFFLFALTFYQISTLDSKFRSATIID